jgi:hypothetical protein
VQSERRAREFLDVLTGQMEERTLRSLAGGGAKELMAQVRNGELNPYSAAREVIENRDAMDELLQESAQGRG